MAKSKSIIDTYNSSKLREKGAPAQQTDFIRTKIAGEIAVEGFKGKALPGITDYNLKDKVLDAARKGTVDTKSPYSAGIRK
jgi:hypothetical protein